MITHTKHDIYLADSRQMKHINDGSINLVVTSPPYPMVGMWDALFNGMNPKVGEVLNVEPLTAFDLMHDELDKVWNECYRVMKDGAFLCVNIGNATRTLANDFRLYDNRYRITKHLLDIGFIELPPIIWRKPQNKPNKFMGSGMLPCLAYVSQGHEYILIFRKGGKRAFNTEGEKALRAESAYFFEERNVWYTDVWDGLVGVRQDLEDASRERSASYPIEVPSRLINMFSIKNDWVLDPFNGLGTTTLAAMLNARNSIGLEIDNELVEPIRTNILSSMDKVKEMEKERLTKHLLYIYGRDFKYHNPKLKCKVASPQETSLAIEQLDNIEEVDGNNGKISFKARYKTN